MKVQSFEAWAQANGRVSTAEADAHIHAGLRCAPTTKTYARWNSRKLAELQGAREAAKADYLAAIARGEVREPTNLERLQANAQGHPDNAATAAAQRVLAKRQARAREALRQPQAGDFFSFEHGWTAG